MANNQLLHTDILDDYDLSFGTDRDIRCRYDETTDDRLEWHDGTNVLAYLKDLGTTGMFGVTGRIECPQIGIAADTDLLALTADQLSISGVLKVGVAETSAHRSVDIRTNTSGFISAVNFLDGTTIKWRVRHLHSTDNIRIYSDTNAADLIVFGTSDIAVGSASTQTMTMTARFLPRSVTDAGPMTATGGTQREIVWNTSDSKHYACTVGHASAATWVALY